jgi:predicted RNA-binding Zn ribbon-like protein
VESTRDMRELDCIGGDIALDFANTLGGARDGPWDDEWLPAYADLLGWGRHAGLLDDATAGALADRAAAHPDEAAAAHAEAIALREAIHAVAAAHARGEPAPAAPLAAVAAAHRAALAHAVLAPAPTTGGGASDGTAGRAGAARRAGADEAGGGAALDWTWDDATDLRRPIWPLAQAAVDLLRSERVARLKQCGHCRWVFLDTSKNRSRRWCSMAHCGTDAKVRSLRARRARARQRPPRQE